MAPSSNATATTSVQVALRIRPNTPQDATSIPARFQRTVIHAISGQAVAVDPTPSGSFSSNSTTGAPGAVPNLAKKQTFAFDQVHGPETSQHSLFTVTAQPLISKFLEGFNCTVLAYGQTSSGKTYSMTGIDLEADPTDPSNGMGIIPRAVSTIFSRARELKEERNGSWNFSVKGSFVELYNEDLIDLLSVDDAGGVRREVQIREDKDGHIIWGGLREVNVKNANEVMSLIRQGTAIRRTNETDMNAQSSRSHAIFSLTLTQKKYSGGGPPPRSSTPLAGAGRSPSRLARPTSTLAGPSGSSRISSPTFGRPSTPSFASAMGRGSGLRPASALGMQSPDSKARVSDEDTGEWVTIISKFHFVDLAGSERLKRTAAVGDRIKEGISINSGLLALGNVISALGDPSRAKSHMASHVPYRDSKLTRLLQDSLGGNAHTLMIACVSPAEWNAGETINTLKYANRARNIKNRAVVTEKEEGWDDTEWLQNMVIRLRKDLKTLKEGGMIPTIRESVEVEGASKKVLAQMVELQSNYEGLRAKFVERTEELTRLRRELGEKHRASTTGAMGGTSKYEEIVGPVIEEYEKTISAMEAELSLNRAALRHTNDLVEEKEEELSLLTERHSATEMYVEELKSRVFKLSEREASTEAYIRDLEEKIKQFEDSNVNSSESVWDFKREIARHKDAEEHSAQYIADLELRLSRSDESVLALRATIEALEQDVDGRKEEVQVLQFRLDSLLSDRDGWQNDLDEREAKVKQLEKKLGEWEARRLEAAEERIRLGGLVNGVQEARSNIESGKTPNNHSNDDSDPETSKPQSIEHQLASLQETHAATLADLSTVTSKYRDALREISDLAAQISEAKLNSPTTSEPPEPEAVPEVQEVPMRRRRMTGPKPRDAADALAIGKAPFFKQAASSESLRSRSLSQSQLLSQELSSARSRMPSSPVLNGVESHHTRSSSSLSITVNGGSAHERSVASLEKEIMRLQEVLKEREGEIITLEKSLKDKDEVNGASPNEVQILINGHTSQSPEPSSDSKHPGDGEDADGSLGRLNELMLSMAQKESQHREIVDELNEQLAHVRRQHDELSRLARDQTHNMSTELEALRGQYEVIFGRMEILQQREQELTQERNSLVQDHTETLAALRTEHEQVLKDSARQTEEVLAKLKESHDLELSELHDQLSSAAEEHLAKELTRLQEEHQAESKKITEEADARLASAKAEFDGIVAQEREEHRLALKTMGDDHSQMLQRVEEEFYTALDKLRRDHSDAIASKESEHAAVITRLNEEHASALKIAELAREGTLTDSQVSQVALLQQVRDEHTAALERKELAFAEDLKRSNADHDRAMTVVREQHEAAIRHLRNSHVTELIKLDEEKSTEVQLIREALAKMQQEHDSVVDEIKSETSAALRQLEEKHLRATEEAKQEHQRVVDKLRSEFETSGTQAKAAHEEVIGNLENQHVQATTSLKAQHQEALSEVRNELVTTQQRHFAEMEESRKHLETNVSQAQERLTSSIADLKASHDKELSILQKDRGVLLEEIASFKSELESHLKATEEMLKSHGAALKQKDQTIGDLQGQLSSAHESGSQYQSEIKSIQAHLQESRSNQSRLKEELSQHESVKAELKQHKTLLNDVQTELVQTKEQRDALLAEKNKQESVVRDLQVQIARNASPPPNEAHLRSASDRSPMFNRVNGIPPSKLPPLTPPPSVPPPPAPKVEVTQSVSTISSNLRSSSSSRESHPDSPPTSAGPSSSGHNGFVTVDPKLVAQVEEQARHLDEQDVMIKTLNKQLTHCESDLQAHMDLVSTLETSLGDSEKNLRKARMQATEIARERDNLASQVDKLRSELEEAKREVVSVRRSVVEEKQTLENRLDEERRAKERTRALLDSRVEELQKRKSKFACL